MAAYLPLTPFCFFILFFQINVVSSHLHPVIWSSQTLSIPAFFQILFLHNGLQKHPLMIVKMTSLYGVWNFDFFRIIYFDIYLGIGILPTLALNYVIAVYPLLLMAIAIVYLLVNLYDKNYRVIVIMEAISSSIFPKTLMSEPP